MRKILIGLAVFAVVLVLIAIVVPLLIPADAYRGRIIQAVQSATGRELRIEGPLSFSILPSIAVEANNVALANAPGATPKDMMTLGKLEVGLKLFPLLSGAVEIDKFVLVDPVVHLEIDKSGHPNWNFSTTPPPTAGTAAQPQAQAQAQSQAQSLRQLRLGKIELTNGTIDYSDARTGAHQEFSKIGLTVRLPSLDDPAAIDGSMDWRGKTVKVSVSAEKPRALMGSGSGALRASVSSDPLTLSYDGSVTGGGPALQLAGALDLDVPSLRDLATWAGNPLPPKQGGLGAFSVKGKLQGSTDNLTVGDVKIALDSIHGTGSVSVATAGAKPTIKGQLDVDKLDFDPYLGSSAKPTGATPPPPGAAPPQPENGWSTEPIDFSPLKAANLDFALGAGAIHYKKLDIGKSALKIRIQDGRLAADLSQLALYDGLGKGSVAIDAAGSVPAMEASFDLAGVQAGPLLSAAIDFTRLTGVGNLNFSLTSRGSSQRELVGALGGKGALAFKNGTIKGLDLLAMAKNVAQSFTAAAGGGSGETAFTELGGTFVIASGILKNDDHALKSPVFAASGSGTIDLPQRRIDYRIQPDVNVPGLNVAVPVLITGPWSNVSYQPDVKGILSQKLGKPGALLQGLKGGTPSGGPTSVLKGLFGGK